VPVISGVGHEIDVTIADLVADRRALTPTDAAQQAVPDRRQLGEQLDGISLRLARALRNRIENAGQALRRTAESYAYRRPLEMIHRQEQRLDGLCDRFYSAARSLLPSHRLAVDPVAEKLHALSPRKVLDRGYSITILARDGKILKRAADTKDGDALRTLLKEGEVRSTVAESRGQQGDHIGGDDDGKRG
jgi:exodeoxyribonuclease VII large subunit